MNIYIYIYTHTHTHKKRGDNIIYELLLEVIIHHHVNFYFILFHAVN